MKPKAVLQNFQVLTVLIFSSSFFIQIKGSKMNEKSSSGHSDMQSNSVLNRKGKAVLIPEPSIREEGLLINSDDSVDSCSAKKMLEATLDESALHAKLIGDDGVSVLIYFHGTGHVQCITVCQICH
jgi:hypothetical protein